MIAPNDAVASPAPKVSIILTTYNFAKYAREAVLSLLNQENAPTFELIVLDDASTDGTVETLADLCDPRLRIRRNERNLGSTATVNLGFRLAAGDYIARLDGDDRWRPNFLNLCSSVLDADPSLGFVFGNVDWIDSTGHITRERGVQHVESADMNSAFKELLKLNYICAPSLMARREAWALSLPWQESLTRGPLDWFASLNMAAVFPGKFLDQVLADYRIHDAGMHVQMMTSRHGESCIEFILDYFFTRFAEKFSAKEIRSIRQCHRLQMASSVLGQRRYVDARRLYRSALDDGWAALIRPEVFRAVIALEILGYDRYEKLKSFVKRSPQ